MQDLIDQAAECTRGHNARTLSTQHVYVIDGYKHIGVVLRLSSNGMFSTCFSSRLAPTPYSEKSALSIRHSSTFLSPWWKEYRTALTERVKSMHHKHISSLCTSRPKLIYTCMRPARRKPELGESSSPAGRGCVCVFLAVEVPKVRLVFAWCWCVT